MSKSDSFTICFVFLCVAVSVSVALLSRAYIEAARDEHAISAGLVQGSIPGVAGVYWVDSERETFTDTETESFDF